MLTCSFSEDRQDRILLATAKLVTIALSWQPGTDPALLALRIVSDVRVTHVRQFPVGFLRGRSHVAHTIDDDLGVLVRKYPWHFVHVFEW